MRRIDFLITEARRLSRNMPNSDGTYAIDDETVLQFLNDAQDRLQALASASKISEKLFVTETIIPLVANQEAYAIPDRLFMNRSIHQVEFSADGTLGNYIVLDKIQTFNRDTNTAQYPVGFSIRGAQIYVTPIPSSSGGYLRIIYERSLDDLDKRRALISTVTGLTSTTFTSITLAASPVPDITSTPNLTSIDYISIVDISGTRKAYNIPVLSYDTGTRVLTPAVGFTFVKTGDTIEANDFVVFHKYRTTHSQLPDDCENYLIYYAAEMMLHKDSSTDVVKANANLARLEDVAVKAIQSQTGTLERIPQLNRYEWW